MLYLLFVLLSCGAALGQSASESFCTEILRLYPSEYVDERIWWQTCQQTHDLDQLMGELHDPMLRIVTDLPVMSDVAYTPNKISTTGYLRLSGFYGGDAFVAQFDSELEKARHDDGLILDLRGAGGGDIETAYQVMSRLTNAPIEGARVKKRLAGEEKTTEKFYRARPRGEWQFDPPLVILVDSTTCWPTQVILWAAKERSQIETVGTLTMGTKCVEPQLVSLPGRLKIQIPTATVTTVDNVKLIGQPYEPNLNINKEPVTALRDPRDPVLYRGTDELYRMLGRLEWLREEMRKQILEKQKAKKEN